MENNIIKNASSKKALKQEIATRHSDPNFYGALSYLPNPDTILRKLGRSQEVFDSIIADAHVIGELRSIRSGLIKYEYRLQAGGEDAADIRALELCQQIMDNKPAKGMQWIDTFWNMAQGVFRGHQVHEVVWKREGQFIVPEKIIDRPQRRFLFTPDNDLRLKTKGAPVDGIELGDYKWLLTRHMPSHENPYGVALLSSCFWPYTFKHNGFKYFVKFCEKYGIPWAIGKYPQGTPKPEQDALADALANMIEDAVAAIPADGTVELLEHKHSGSLVQESLIKMCNSEMSKALTSQTLATEIQGEGSRAAAETHRGREESVNDSDRVIISAAMNELFAWITEINIAGAAPPKFEFYQEEEARKEWVEVFKDAREFIDIPAKFAHDRLQIPMAQDGEDVLPKTTVSTPLESDFSKGTCHVCHHDFASAQDLTTALSEQASELADDIIEGMIDEVRALLFSVDTLEEYRDGLLEIYPDITQSKLGEMTSLALMTGALQGVEDAQ
ncbi:MAG: DUF935 family protein [Methylophaga sp.]|nr:DUF935 family protein [Methylophaga sp.]